jgi:hypothetical protein
MASEQRVPIRKLDGHGNVRNFYAIKLQPSMKLSKSTTITSAEALNASTGIHVPTAYRRNSLAPKVFILHDAKASKTYKTMPVDHTSNAYRYVVFAHDGKTLQYSECKMNKLIFASQSTQEDVALDQLEKLNREREKTIQKSLGSRFKAFDVDQLDTNGPVSAFVGKKADKDDIIALRERQQAAEDDRDEFSNKHKKSSRVDLGFGDEENALDFEQEFDDDDGEAVAEDEEPDEDAEEGKKLKKLLNEDSSDEEDNTKTNSQTADQDNLQDVPDEGSSDEDQKLSGKKRPAAGSSGAPDAKKVI